MPLEVEKLTPESGQPAIDAAISASMSQCMKEGVRTQKECAGMIYGMARDKTGKALDRGNR